MDRDLPPQSALALSQSSKIINQKLDPVIHLPAEVIADIVSLLGIEDRECLRGLSKHWKEFSEYFNTKQAIVQHFPRYRYPSLGTSQEYKLLCRRLIHLQAHQKRGLITRIHRFPEVNEWMIKNHRLQVKRPGEFSSIVDLRTTLEVDSSRSWLSIRSLLEATNGTSLHARFLSLTDAGDYIVGLGAFGLGAFPSTSALAKITATGTAAWSVSTSLDIVAVGENNLYTLVCVGNPHGNYSLTVRRLEDGAMISESATHHLPLGRFTLNGLDAMLTGNEEILIIKDHTEIGFLVETSTGRKVNLRAPWSSGVVLTTTVVTQSGSSDFTVGSLEQRKTKRFYEIYSFTLDKANTPIHYSEARIQIVELDGMWIPCGIDLVNDLIFVQRQSSNGESTEFGVAGFEPETRESEFQTETTVIPTEEVRRVNLVIPHEDEPEITRRLRLGKGREGLASDSSGLGL